MPIIAKVDPVPGGIVTPRYPQTNAFTEISKGLGAFGEIAEHIQKSHDDLWVAQSEADYIRQLSDKKDEAATNEPDTLKRIESYGKTQGQLQQDFLKQAPSPDAANRFTMRAGLIAAHDFATYKQKQLSEWGNQRLADFTLQEDQLAKDEAKTTDPTEAAVYRTAFKDGLAGLQRPPFKAIEPEHAARLTLQHQKKVLENTAANYLDNEDFDGFRAAKKSGVFDGLDAMTMFHLDSRATAAEQEAQNAKNRELTTSRKAIFDVYDQAADRGQLRPDQVQQLRSMRTVLSPEQLDQLDKRARSPGIAALPSQVADIERSWYDGNKNRPATDAALRGVNRVLADHKQDPEALRLKQRIVDHSNALATQEGLSRAQQKLGYYTSIEKMIPGATGPMTLRIQRKTAAAWKQEFDFLTDNPDPKERKSQEEAFSIIQQRIKGGAVPGSIPMPTQKETQTDSFMKE